MIDCIYLNVFSGTGLLLTGQNVGQQYNMAEVKGACFCEDSICFGSFLERDPGFGGGLSTRFEVLLKVGTVIRLDETVGTAGTTFVLVLFGCWTFFNCPHFLKGSHHLRFWMGLHFRFE